MEFIDDFSPHTTRSISAPFSWLINCIARKNEHQNFVSLLQGLICKTVSYHLHLLCPPISLKKWECFFSQNFFFMNFSNFFSKFKSSPNSLKKISQIRLEKYFEKNFYTHSTANLPPLLILKIKSTFLSEEPMFFQKISNFVLTISVPFYGNFTVIWRLKESNSESFQDIETFSFG